MSQIKPKGLLIMLLIWILLGIGFDILMFFALGTEAQEILYASDISDYINQMVTHPLTFVTRALMSNILAFDVFIGLILNGAPANVNPYLFITIMLLKMILPPFVMAMVFVKKNEYDRSLIQHAGRAIDTACMLAVGLTIVLSVLLFLDNSNSTNGLYTDGWNGDQIINIISLLEIVYGQPIWIVDSSLTYFGIERTSRNFLSSPNPIINEIGSYIGGIFTVFGMLFVQVAFTNFFAMAIVQKHDR